MNTDLQAKIDTTRATTVAALVRAAESAGVDFYLSPETGEPRARGPASALQHYQRLLSPWRDTLAALIEARAERAAIMQFDGGLSAAAAETEAKRLLP